MHMTEQDNELADFMAAEIESFIKLNVNKRSVSTAEVITMAYVSAFKRGRDGRRRDPQ